MTEPSSFVIMLTTIPADGDWVALARTLVDERLAACVSGFEPMRSIYRWEEAVTEARERQLIIKTTAAAVPALQSRLAALHPYDVPECLVLPVAGSDAYLGWIAASVEPGPTRA